MIAIACVGKNMELGRNGQLIFHSERDMRWFRAMTLGNTVIMGRKTYESLGGPLPERRNVVLSKSPRPDSAKTVEWVGSIKELHNAINEPDSTVVIGGASIYKQLLPFCDSIALTEVDAEAEADTFFPDFDKNEFDVRTLQGWDEGGLHYAIKWYERKVKNEI